jgi:peptidoglycan/xylan/chitin deacetylase (PgdA/CDA1 family)
LRVALTFDAEHPGRPTIAGTEERILQSLAAAGIRATFFLQGGWARAYPGRARAIAEGGHLVGNHSHHHAPMDALNDDGLRADVRKAEDAIRAATGADPKPWFRCPFGAGMEDPRVLGHIGALGYRHVGWDVDPRDWEEGRTPDELVTRVLTGVHVCEESVVLLHTWPAVTAETLARLVERLIAERVEFVRVDELSGDAQRIAAR